MAKVLRAIKPNAGVRDEYRRRLCELLERMHGSFLWAVKNAYTEEEDAIEEAYGMDASPASRLTRLIRRLTRQWQSRWDEAAEEIAEMFVNSSYRRVESSMRQALKDAGFTIKMPPERVLNDTIQACIQYNVSLIQSIGKEYMGQVENLVMQSTVMGRDVAYLEEELDRRFLKDRNRANIVARDQSNKVTEAIKRAEAAELGITEGIWVHVPGVKQSRKTHMEFNGQRFELNKGLYDSDVDDFVLPGDCILCQCTYRAVIPEFGD